MTYQNTPVNEDNIASVLKQMNTKEEVAIVLQYLEKLGYKSKNLKKEFEMIQDIIQDYPNKDPIQCAKEMYAWFWEDGKKIKNYISTFRNWIKKDYAPKRKKKVEEDIFANPDNLW